MKEGIAIFAPDLGIYSKRARNLKWNDLEDGLNSDKSQNFSVSQSSMGVKGLKTESLLANI